MSQTQEPFLAESTTVQSFSNSEIHVWRMRVSVFWSIIIQFLLLFLYILFINLDVFHPLVWLENCFSVFMSISIWLRLCVLIIIIYIQGNLCEKDYVTGSTYYKTRFEKIRNVFSFRNIFLLMLHMVIGSTIFWIYSSVSGSTYNSMTRHCQVNALSSNLEDCLVEGKLFLLLGGLWLGVYYFANDYMFGSRSLSFPLIQQYKFYRVKAALRQNVKKSLKQSILPTIIFLVLYYLYGGFARQKLIQWLSCRLETQPIDTIKGLLNIQHILSLWLFSSIFIVTSQMMELLFNVHLTEHCVFPITTTMYPPGKYMSLVDSLKICNIPIIHHLGYLDLFTLSTKCRKRREEIFTLSHPGGHPHFWNGIFQECTHLIKTFTNDLNQALQKAASTEKEINKPAPKPEVISFHFHSHNVRRLASPLTQNDSGPRLNTNRPIEYQSGVELAFITIQNWLNIKLEHVYRKPYIAYFFAESPDSRINYLLGQCQPVIWAVQSLAFLTAASLTEDRYGIVQRDLSDVIINIVTLKQALDKLFKQGLIVKKSFANDSVDIQMKYLLRTSVKRSLYKIAIAFGPYVKDLKLPVDISVQMNNFIAFKEVL